MKSIRCSPKTSRSDGNPWGLDETTELIREFNEPMYDLLTLQAQNTFEPGIPRLAAEQPCLDGLGLQPEVRASTINQSSEGATLPSRDRRRCSAACGIPGHRDLWLKPQAIGTPLFHSESQVDSRRSIFEAFRDWLQSSRGLIASGISPRYGPAP